MRGASSQGVRTPNVGPNGNLYAARGNASPRGQGPGDRSGMPPSPGPPRRPPTMTPAPTPHSDSSPRPRTPPTTPARRYGRWGTRKCTRACRWTRRASAGVSVRDQNRAWPSARLSGCLDTRKARERAGWRNRLITCWPLLRPGISGLSSLPGIVQVSEKLVRPLECLHKTGGTSSLVAYTRKKTLECHAS